MGLAFSAQVSATPLPLESHDVRMQRVITEKENFEFAPVKILFFGDIIGRVGREGLLKFCRLEGNPSAGLHYRERRERRPRERAVARRWLRNSGRKAWTS